MTKATPLAERFWAKVHKGDVCWNWTGSRTAAGYGEVFLGPGCGSGYAHRVAYELLVGPIPVGLQIDHLCRNRRCVNPEHMEPVTSAENTARGQFPPPKSKILSDQQVREIRYRRSAGERGSDLAERYGVAQQTICNIVKGRMRANAGGPIYAPSVPEGEGEA